MQNLSYIHIGIVNFLHKPLNAMDVASYTNCKRIIERDKLPEADAVRNVNELRYNQNKKAEPTATSEPRGEIMYVNVRYKSPYGSVSKLITALVVASSEVLKPSADCNFASAVTMFAPKLSASQYMDGARMIASLMAGSSYGSDGYGCRREFVRLEETARGCAEVGCEHLERGGRYF